MQRNKEVEVRKYPSDDLLILIRELHHGSLHNPDPPGPEETKASDGKREGIRHHHFEILSQQIVSRTCARSRVAVLQQMIGTFVESFGRDDLEPE